MTVRARTGDTAATRTPTGTAEADLATGTIRVALLVRQIALAAAGIAALAGTRVDWPALLVVAALLLTSQLGLHSTSLLRLVERHPSIALGDVLLVAAATVLLGPRHPVVLAALTSALVVGVLFRRAVSPLMVVPLLAGYALSLLQLSAPNLDDIVGTPVVIVSVAAIGAGFRRLSEQARRKDLQAAMAQRAAAAAEERLRLARDVHDTVAKSVQGVALLASTLPHWIQRDSERAAAHADLVAASAREAVVEARALLTGLRTVTDEVRIEDWLGARVRAWSAGRCGTVRAVLQPVPPLAPRACAELRAAVDEALENVDRHAPDADVDLTLVAEDDLVTVVVRDHGPGFTQGRRQRAERHGRYGLLGMHERLESVGGSTRVESAPGHGTTVTLIAPAARAADTEGVPPSLRIVS